MRSFDPEIVCRSSRVEATTAVLYPRAMSFAPRGRAWRLIGWIEFGIEAGARRAFGKSARLLTAQQGALMAAILPNPIRRSASRPRPAVQRLGGIYLARAHARMAAGLDRCLRR